MNRSILAPSLLVLPPLLIILSLAAAHSLPQPWGALQAPASAGAVCPGGARVSSGAVDAAWVSLSAAIAERDRALSGGSSYAAAKVGLPPASADWAAAEEAQAGVRMARADLAKVCADGR